MGVSWPGAGTLFRGFTFFPSRKRTGGVDQGCLEVIAVQQHTLGGLVIAAVMGLRKLCE